MKRWKKIVLGVPLLAATAFAGWVAWLAIDDGQPSRCTGHNAQGTLERGRRLPYWGENFRGYSLFGHVTGRTFMHSSVRDVLRDSYAELAKQHPELRFIYAEGSWPWGGKLRPHYTHQNGSAIDFHVPVRNGDGQVDWMPTSVFSLFGYAIDFDRQGKLGSLAIDFEAMAQHLLALDRAARARGVPIRRVIFDVELQPRLFATRSGAQLRGRLQFNSRQAWVRHDEHYHVEFAVACR
jgi:penicillin-insensitive murein endopeptidase